MAASIIQEGLGRGKDKVMVKESRERGRELKQRQRDRRWSREARKKAM